ncbi:hypothetical protein ACFYT3_31275 [Nocardia amikacinitolerans]|uniref:hypothetical protein n=1 Tax=Nocardia amikacinitolerans TaxID=756689 RepID=UPI0036A5DAE8
MGVDDPRETATIQIRFLRHLLDRLEALAGESAPWEGITRLHAVINARLSVLTDSGPPEQDTDTAHGRAVSIAVELHRLRRSKTAATITLAGGHHHRGRIGAVGRRHAVVHHHGNDGRQARVLVPLRFIESVHPHHLARGR